MSDVTVHQPRPVRVGGSLLKAAAERLVSQDLGDRSSAADRLIATAPAHGIDLSMIFATTEPTSQGTDVRQACLVVPGAGRTAMVFLSEPPRGGDWGTPEQAAAERAACINLACEHLVRERPGLCAVAQALPEPKDAWALRACRAAGFRDVGTLLYLRRALGSNTGLVPEGEAPAARFTTRSVAEVAEGDRDGLLVRALERTYEGTLDCPELCGMRSTRDILASHRATGRFDPALWWLLMDESGPEGCVLLSRCPEQRSVELVYLGVSPAARGKGLMRWLFSHAIRKARPGSGGWSLTCAVDARNAPARKLYDAFGFQAFGERVALVRPIDARA